MHHRLPQLLAAAGVLSAFALPAAVAQTAPLVTQTRPISLASAAFDNPTTANVTVYTKLVVAPGAPWVRLHFDTAVVTGKSYIEVVSLDDGAIQRLDAAALQSWENHTAYFNGDTVLVRLVTGPGTRGNRIAADDVEYGVTVPPPPSICGVDNRVLSTDKRVARVMPVVCTGWLASPTNMIVSAGHCCGTSFRTAQFNVPPSTAGGAIRHPPPEDQYPVDRGTIQRRSGGIGNDWCVSLLRVNSSTGQHAGERQGQHFTVGFYRPTTGRSIRVTGHGSASGNRNNAQTTHAGPLRRNGGTTLCYSTDTTGGNSGSPVIDETTGQAVGVHTHAGCGPSGGCNSGTSSLNAAFRNALFVAAPVVNQITPSTVTSFQPAQITLTGTALDRVDSLTVGGVSVPFSSSSSTSLTFALPSPFEIKTHAVVATNNGGSSSPVNLTVTGNHPSVLVTPALVVRGFASPYSVHTDAGWFATLLVSGSNAPSALPGIVSLQIGANFSQLTEVTTLVADNAGEATVQLTVPFGASPGTIHFQAITFAPPVTFPLEVSNPSPTLIF